MRILVLSPLSFPSLGKYLPDWVFGPEHGLRVDVKDRVLGGEPKPDAIVCMSVSRTTDTAFALSLWPDVPLFVYHWDCYSWIWLRPRANEYNYGVYGELLKRAKEIWVPSVCTGKQASLWWSLYNWVVIHPAVNLLPQNTPTVQGEYVYCALRTLPDAWAYKLDEACSKLGIPYVKTDHGIPYANYQKTISNCRLIVNHYTEASTGGLTLLEAYALGKPVLCTDSEWNGAGEYFADRAYYFRHGDVRSFQERLRQLYDDPPKPPRDCYEWVQRHFSHEAMVKRISERLHANLS